MSVFAVIYTYILVTAIGAGVFAVLGTSDARRNRPETMRVPSAAVEKKAA